MYNREVTEFAYEKPEFLKVTSCNSQCNTTYLQVILQVSGKYFAETSGFLKNSLHCTFTECHLYFELYKNVSGFLFLIGNQT